MATTTQRISLKGMVRQFVRESLDGQDEIDGHQLIDQARSHFRGDPVFEAAAIEQALLYLVPEVLAEEIRGTRHGLIPTASGAVSTSRLDMTAHERLGVIFERTASGGYASILAMRKGDARTALDGREQAVAGHMPFINFWREVLPKMDERRTVGETFSKRQLDQLWNRHFKPE